MFRESLRIFECTQTTTEATIKCEGQVQACLVKVYLFRSVSAPVRSEEILVFLPVSSVN